MTTGKFYPAAAFITSITLGQNTVIGFSEVHDFTIGEVVSFRVSKISGTFELNNLEATVISVSDFTITVPIDSTNWTPFVAMGFFIQSPSMVIPSASGVVPHSHPPMTNLVDAFDDIPVD